ncbi:Pkinase-domain-containing protein [Hesseltinella vesiculosa]|uniref:Pkinase-domain-containing protein n=1 Tax=Hesseltinella vesiculosa TaxID=101127 RepID=A0A1X2GE30_9FUNG|nr:Pkinase-domain-containing protein [Hesseltinella vesiculosa]
MDILRNIFKNKKVFKLSGEEKKEVNEAASLFVKQRLSKKTQLPNYPNLDRYELITKVGDGAFSVVYEAHDKKSDQLVAVKIAVKHELSEKNNLHLHPNVKKRTKVTERANIMKEVQIMRGVNHPNIVKLVDCSESKDYYYMVLELCSGGELFQQIVKMTYFSEDLSRHVIYQVASAVRYLHEECGVVHRDIKPENILFETIPIIPSKKPKIVFMDEEKEDEGEFIFGKGGGGIGQVKLADFGLSKVIWDTNTKTPVGTAGYTAPEIVTTQTYSKSVDMWAIGCVLYTMLCGFPPFYDESIRALTSKVIKGQYTFLSPWWDPVSKPAKNLVTHLLCVDPNERYTIDEFFEHPWIKSHHSPPSSSASSRSSDHVGHRKPRTRDTREMAMQNAARKARHQNGSPPSITSTPASSVASSPNITPQHESHKGLADATAVATQEPAAETVKDAQEQEDEQSNIDDILPLQTPSGGAKRQDLFTPGFATLKEILDITYAVQRMGEESPQHLEIDTESNLGDDDDSILTDDNASSCSRRTRSTSTSTQNRGEPSSAASILSTSMPRTDGFTDELIARAEKLALSGKGYAHATSPRSSTSKSRHGHSLSLGDAQHSQTLNTPASHRKKHAFKLSLDQASLLKKRNHPS